MVARLHVARYFFKNQNYNLNFQKILKKNLGIFNYIFYESANLVAKYLVIQSTQY
jgi:hypothetical protein